jgi:hypothetical protein
MLFQGQRSKERCRKEESKEERALGKNSKATNDSTVGISHQGCRKTPLSWMSQLTQTRNCSGQIVIPEVY